MDFFTRLDSPPSFDAICDCARTAAATNEVKFLSDTYVHGIDNCYANGNLAQWVKDINNFWENVDEIAERRRGIRFQERLVYEEMKRVVARSDLFDIKGVGLGGRTWNAKQ
jgi:hypothetical protein